MILLFSRGFRVHSDLYLLDLKKDLFVLVKYQSRQKAKLSVPDNDVFVLKKKRPFYKICHILFKKYPHTSNEPNHGAFCMNNKVSRYKKVLWNKKKIDTVCTSWKIGLIQVQIYSQTAIEPKMVHFSKQQSDLARI